MTWTPGQTLHHDKYKVKQELGQGIVAITYLATNREGDDVVIKTLNPDLLNQLTDKERSYLGSGFLDEARKLVICKHPNIVNVIETFQERDLQCMVMEYIHGSNLDKIIQTRKFLPEQEALDYIQQIGQALSEVHKQGFLHRDVKPENIMLRAGTHQAVLIDFDLARGIDNPLTSRGMKVDGFIPLELYSNSVRQQKRRGPWTDIYSLSATLYTLLTGQQPVNAIDRKDQNQRLIPPQELNNQISTRVSNAIVHGMGLEPNDRPKTVEVWLKELGLQKSGLTLLKLPIKFFLIPRDNNYLRWLLGGIVAVFGVAATIDPLISVINNVMQLIEKVPQKNQSPVNSTTQDNPSFPNQPKK
jgi:eukaryotic-like serine/threonine-protein kinase